MTSDTRAQQAPESGAKRITLALSGGNALGAYAAGAYEALHASGLRIDTISGASIGAVTAAMIGGNPPDVRIEKLREFWAQAASGSGLAPMTEWWRDAYNKMQTAQTLMFGRPGMFKPRARGFLSMMPGTWPDIGLFDPRPLVSTLGRVVDFDYLNRAELPVIITSVDLETGESVFFDSRVEPITPEHLLASTAFLPGFPPVEIGGRLLGDAGVHSNLPLDPLLSASEPGRHLCIAVDLFDARGDRPFSMDTALERAQDICFGMQSIRTIDAHLDRHRLRHQLAELQRHDGAAKETQLDVVLIAYRPLPHETGGKALEFSRASIAERWSAGKDDMERALAALKAGDATDSAHGVSFYDCRRSAPRSTVRGKPEPVTAVDRTAQP